MMQQTWTGYVELVVFKLLLATPSPYVYQEGGLLDPG